MRDVWCGLSLCSKVMYVYCMSEDVCKSLYFREADSYLHNGYTVKTYGTWKNTLGSLLLSSWGKQGEVLWRDGKRANGPSNCLKIHVTGLYSDVLFTPHRIAHEEICPSWLHGETIDRRDGRFFSTEQFRNEYESLSRPVVMVGAVSEWPAIRKWNKEYLRGPMGKTRVHAGGLEFLLSDYIDYTETFTAESQPLYIFDHQLGTRAPKMMSDFSPPPYFGDSSFLGHEKGEIDEEDLFSVLGQDNRPQYRWIIIGPRGSQSLWHQDPNCTSAWNACVVGRKRWIMLPPNIVPPGVYPSSDLCSVVQPATLKEWYKEFYKECLQFGALEVTVCPGDVMFVPSGWWHAVLNLDDFNVAITQNYVNWTNVRRVLNFLLTKPHDISGILDNQRQTLGRCFEAVLREKYPRQTALALDGEGDNVSVDNVSVDNDKETVKTEEDLETGELNRTRSRKSNIFSPFPTSKFFCFDFHGTVTLP